MDLHAFLEAGVPVALCCDNSTVSRTNALEESALAAALLGGIVCQIGHLCLSPRLKMTIGSFSSPGVGPYPRQLPQIG